MKKKLTPEQAARLARYDAVCGHLEAAADVYRDAEGLDLGEQRTRCSVLRLALRVIRRSSLPERARKKALTAMAGAWRLGFSRHTREVSTVNSRLK